MAARGRVTAAPVMARRSSPAAHQAAMDGFAVAAAATFGATPESPRLLRLGQEAFAVNTGHVMPPGTDAVIMVEQIPDPEADPIVIEAPIFPWQHVRRVGEDLVRGEMVLPEGIEINPWSQGACWPPGVTRVAVFAAPGRPSSPPGTRWCPPEWRRSRAAACRSSTPAILSGLVLEAGGAAAGEAHRSRRRRGPERRDQEAPTASDLVLINAGSSAGTEDYTYQAIAALGRSGARGGHDAGQTHPVGGGGEASRSSATRGYPVSPVLSFEQFAACR